MCSVRWITFLAVLGLALPSCKHHRPEITAVSLSNPCEPEGIPFYLPKPLLIIAKNFRNIEESHVGDMGPAPIPDSFDEQQQYADLKANVAISDAPRFDNGDAKKPAGTMGTMVTPEGKIIQSRILPSGSVTGDPTGTEVFYTYHIVFVPDLTQKYALRVRGGAGEIRAAMNLVNGWMFTGMGPYYMKDSSTAQNMMAAGAMVALGGRGIADVTNSLANLAEAAKPGPTFAQLSPQHVYETFVEMESVLEASGQKLDQIVVPNHAEIYVYEPVLIGGQMEWRPVASHMFNRVITHMPTSIKRKITPLAGLQQSKAGQGPKTDGENPPFEPPDSKPEETSGALNQGQDETGARLPLPFEKEFRQKVARDFFGAESRVPTPTAGAISGDAGTNVTVNVNGRGNLGFNHPLKKLFRRLHPDTPQVRNTVLNSVGEGTMVETTTGLIRTTPVEHGE